MFTDMHSRGFSLVALSCRRKAAQVLSFLVREKQCVSRLTCLSERSASRCIDQITKLPLLSFDVVPSAA